MSRSVSVVVVAILATLATSAGAFVAPGRHQVSARTTNQFSTAAYVFGKKPKDDLSFIESRDMTREEMLALNKKNEDIMNMELQAMTGFSLVLSLPILYLCWVAFFSD